jgi:hypothetical protein
MKTFKNYLKNKSMYLESNDPESPSAGVSQVQQPQAQQPQAQQPQAQQPQAQVQQSARKEAEKLMRMLSVKLGEKYANYTPLLKDIQPKNIQLFSSLVRELSTMNQSTGASAVNKATR